MIISRILKLSSFLALIAVAVASGLPTAHSAAAEKGSVTVLDRKRLGGYIEETTFIPNGPYANHIAMTNGYEILGVPLNARG